MPIKTLEKHSLAMTRKDVDFLLPTTGSSRCKTRFFEVLRWKNIGI